MLKKSLFEDVIFYGKLANTTEDHRQSKGKINFNENIRDTSTLDVCNAYVVKRPEKNNSN